MIIIITQRISSKKLLDLISVHIEMLTRCRNSEKTHSLIFRTINKAIVTCPYTDSYQNNKDNKVFLFTKKLWNGLSESSPQFGGRGMAFINRLFIITFSSNAFGKESQRLSYYSCNLINSDSEWDFLIVLEEITFLSEKHLISTT